MKIIRKGDRFQIPAKLTGAVPARLRMRMPCCKGEKRPEYDNVRYFVEKNGGFTMRCNQCRWLWKVTKVADEGTHFLVTVEA